MIILTFTKVRERADKHVFGGLAFWKTHIKCSISKH